MNAEEISRREKHSRCVALEEDYVHEVYEKIGKDLVHAKDPLAVKVQNFLDDLEPGSLVADIGCGDGRYLRNKDGIFSLGTDSSCLQTSLARQRCQEAVLGNNLSLPFRGNAFDAVLSVGVIHHFATRERRIKALKELARILRIGGRILIAVRKNNTQNSQDVLIPWFDVPKDKKIKDKCWLEQDSGEYELEDDVDDDDDEEDSISLPSSDEDDTLWTTDAKFFPPHTQCNAKHRWSSERQWRSLDFDYQASSSNVPNSKQIVQTNACYAFVRKALKRFSSVNSPDEDACFTSDFYNRVDSAVPPSPTNGQEQKLGSSNHSSLDLNESVQTTINENFIELLNIDDDTDTSNFHRGRDGAGESLYHSNSKHNSHLNKNKSTLIRSVSDMFRNMNSLWSSKGTKSCSDLKSQTVPHDSNFGRTKPDSRLTRSKTTASCKPEFDFFSSLENIEEIEMTLSEANKIINDFLESSASSLQCLNMSDEETNELIFTSLTQSDIVNGNTLSLLDDSFDCKKIRKNVQDTSGSYKHKENVKYRCFEDERLSFEKPKQHFDLRKETLRKNIIKFGKSQVFENSVFPRDFRFGIPFDRSDSFVYTDSDSEDALSDISDTIYMDESFERDKESACSDQGTLGETKIIDEKSESTNLSMFSSTQDESIESNQKLNRELSPVSDIPVLKTPYENSSFPTLDEFPFKNHTSNPKERNVGQSSIATTSKLSKSKEEERIPAEILQLNDSDANYSCILHSSPKRIRKATQNYKYHMAGSKTLGPFYDEDDDYSCGEDCATLSSYYSMPELHAISDFYLEYSIYQSNYMNDTTAELTKFQEKYPLKSEKSSVISQIDKNDCKMGESLSVSEKCDLTHSNSETSSCKETLDSSFCVENREANVNKSVNSNLTPCCSELSINKFKITSLSKSNLVKDEIKRLALCPSNISNQNHPVFLNANNKCKSLISFHNQNYDVICSNNPFIAYNKVSRSQSIGAVPEYLINKKYEKINSSFLSSSQHSLIHSCEKETPCLNINKIKLSENILSSNTSANFVNNDSIVTTIVPKVIPVLKEIYETPDNRAFHQESANCLNSTPKSASIKRKISCSSYLREENLNVSGNTDNYLKSVEKNSVLSCEISSNSNINLPPSKNTPSQNEEVCDNSKKRISIVFQPSMLLTEDQICHGDKNVMQEFSDRSFAPLLKSSDNLRERNLSDTSPKGMKSEESNDFSSIFPVNKSAGFENSHITQNVKKESTEALKLYGRSQNISGTILEVSDSNTCSDSHEHGTQEEVTGDSPIRFLSKNISQNKLASQFHEDLVCSVNNNENGAIIPVNTESPIKENLMDAVLPGVYTSIVPKMVTDVPLSLGPVESAVRVTNKQQSEERNDLKLTNASGDSYQESIDCAYGRIHEDGAVVVGHRYHHLFEEEELDDLIENNISELHVLNSFHHESHWCIIAEKVRVWNI